MVEFCIFAVHRKETAAAKKESRINKIILVVKHEAKVGVQIFYNRSRKHKVNYHRAIKTRS